MSEGGTNTEIELTLRKTAELHNISSSYLSRCVREGKVAKGYDLTQYVRLDNDGHVSAFVFPSEYDFPTESNGDHSGSEAIRNCIVEEPSRKEVARERAMEVLVGGNSTPKDDAITHVLFERAEVSQSSGVFARSDDALHAGSQVWGRLQEVVDEGHRFVTRISASDPKPIEWIAENFGSGTYRLSRTEMGSDVHFTFSVSRRRPAEIDQKLARLDEKEDQILQLRSLLKRRDHQIREMESDFADVRKSLQADLDARREEILELENRIWKLKNDHEDEVWKLQNEQEEVLFELNSELEDERSAHRRVEDDLNYLKFTFEDKIREVQKRIEREKREELYAEAEKLNAKIIELEDEKYDLEWQLKLERTKTELERKNAAKPGSALEALFKRVTEALEENPGAVKKLLDRLLRPTKKHGHNANTER